MTINKNSHQHGNKIIGTKNSQKMAKMFSSLRLATMRSHKKQRPGSVTTTGSSESARTEETTASTNQANFYGTNFFALDELVENANTPNCGLISKVAQVSTKLI